MLDCFVCWMLDSSFVFANHRQTRCSPNVFAFFGGREGRAGERAGARAGRQAGRLAGGRAGALAQ